jgi:outer membrane protein OmpA-like peptidoglycan-associated protein
MNKLFCCFYVFCNFNSVAQLNIFFPYNQYHIPLDQQYTLDSFLIHTKNTQLFTIKGFTDTIGSFDYNLSLAKKRAIAVKKYITKKLNNAVTVNYYGENNDFKNDSLNRRVEISITSNEVNIEPKIAERISFSKIYFIPSTPIIKEESFIHVEELCTQVKQLRNKRIEIRGHINWVNPNDTIPTQYKSLSYERAFAVYNYVKAKGIDVSKITCRGMGTTEMIYPYPKNSYEQEQNMRVEIVVIE